MNEETINTNSNNTAKQEQTQTHGSFEQFLHEAGELVLTLGQVAGKAAEDLTGLMVLPVNKDLRGKMDGLVDAGAAKNRGEAALMLLRDGIASNQKVYDQVEKTRAQIDALRSQLRGLIGQQS